MTKTLADMEKRMANVEKNMAINTANTCVKLGNMERNMETYMANVGGKLEAVNNEVKGLKATLIESFNEIKEVLVKMEDTREENTTKVSGRASGDKENIIVAGGIGSDSVEIFNWRQKLWSPLQSMPEKRFGATSFVYKNHMMIAGGYCMGTGYVDNMITANIEPNPFLSTHWSECPVKLPAKLAGHSSVLYNDQLIVIGGEYSNATSDCIDEVQLVPLYSVKTLLRMPEQGKFHSTQIFDDSLLIVGGNNLSSVLLYDIKKNECKQLAPLQYEVSQMATVRWGDNIVVIGGNDKHGKVLDTVIIYNVKTEQHHMLPSMRCKRAGCTAVVIRNNIVVLRGIEERLCDQRSVEALNIDHNT